MNEFPRKRLAKFRRTRRRLKDDEVREALRAELKLAYESGASIRDLAETHRLAFGTVRSLLLEAGVTLRPRGGPNHVRLDDGRVPDDSLESQTPRNDIS